jgi:hypothetical protein
MRVWTQYRCSKIESLTCTVKSFLNIHFFLVAFREFDNGTSRARCLSLESWLLCMYFVKASTNIVQTSRGHCYN